MTWLILGMPPLVGDGIARSGYVRCVHRIAPLSGGCTFSVQSVSAIDLLVF